MVKLWEVVNLLVHVAPTIVAIYMRPIGGGNAKKFSLSNMDSSVEGTPGLELNREKQLLFWIQSGARAFLSSRVHARSVTWRQFL